MLQFITKKLNTWFIRTQNPGKSHADMQKMQESLTSVMSENISKFKETLGNSIDLVIRNFNFGPDQKLHAALLYIDGLTDMQTINQSIVKPLMYDGGAAQGVRHIKPSTMEEVRDTILAVGEVKEVTLLEEAMDGCLMGDTVFLLDGCASALMISTKGWETRGITEPSTESVVRGPREGFTENIRTNTVLLRRKIKTPALHFESLRIGRKTRTPVSIAYIEGLASNRLIREVRKRLSAIEVDSILESGYIEQFIEDAPYSIFSTIGNSEKPDVVAARILEGRVAILVDGTPFVLTAPMLMVESFQTAEDYYIRPYFATMLRVLRYFSFFISILGPSAYVALTTFHQELLPTDLLYTMAHSKEGTPFPAVLEAAIMMITYEILREAGLRLPRPVGQAISIVGALVMGEASVSAGIVGAPVVIVISITAVSSFVVPAQADAGAILRFVMLLLAATMGGYGLTMGLMAVLVHLVSLKSFGFPYLSPIAPVQFADLKDTVFRAPLWTMLTRPKGMSQDKKRQELTVPGEAASQDDHIVD